MRLLAFSLGRGITDRISRIVGHGSAVACPTLQRLSTAGFHEDDIVIAKASSLIRESLRASIGSRSIIAIMDDDIPLEGVVRIGEDFSDFELLEAVETASAERGIHSSIREGMAGSSDVMRRTRRLMQMASMSTLPLHIIGDTGTGKTHAARLIHGCGGSGRSIVIESCGCLVNGIADSTLFGHTKGAFSSASDERGGILAAADGSTLFLDEIEDLPMDLQSKLLQVLDTGEYRRLGSDRICRSRFRLITASNVPLKKLMEEHRLRKDFYYRISGIELRMPSLSEHMEDIPELLAAYERRSGYGHVITDCTPFMHPFPGNVRELFKAAELHLQGFRHYASEVDSGGFQPV